MAGLTFSHKHYVPILKTKTGERWALSFLQPVIKTHLTPLLEMHEHDTHDTADHADVICDNLVSQWGTTEPFFLDTVLLHDSSGHAATITTVFDLARAYGLLAIPVIRTSYDAASLAAVGAIAAADGRGCMMRATPNDLAAPATIGAAIGATGIAVGDSHFMLDYFRDAMTLAADVPLVPSLATWATFSAASGAFPQSVFNLVQGTWHSIPRQDWTTWLTDVTGAPAWRLPAFSDYAMRDPGKPAGFGDPIVNVRYTTASEWRVHTGGKHKQGFGHQMRNVCASLIAQPFYSGGTFSEGDAQFYAVAAPGSRYGGPTQWLQWSVNHHLVFAAHQIQSHPAL